MILDLPRFIAAERAYWSELEGVLNKLREEGGGRMPLAEAQRFHFLYERCSADLARLDTAAPEPGLRAFLESLVARAYCEIHETRTARFQFAWRNWFTALPRAFRRHFGAFRVSLGATLLGCAFGWFVLAIDPQSKSVLMPFPGLLAPPAERVKQEESRQPDHLREVRATFSAELMTHNIRTTVLTFAAGMSWGLGTLIVLFYNGVTLGAVVADYVAAHQAVFLLGWLLPHGSIEIPAILLGGQAGFVLAGALIGWGERVSRAARLRAVAHDMFVIAAGAAALLVWAGIVEAFLSQYHQPVLPYGLKIAFGSLELLALSIYLSRAGRR